MNPHLVTKKESQSVLIVGGAGYLGSVVSERLAEAGHQVRVYDKMLFGETSVRSLRERFGSTIVVGDIRDSKSIAAAMDGIDSVILLAALVGEPACDRDPRLTREVNFEAPKAMAEAAKKCGVTRFIFASTDSAYGIQEGIMDESSPLKPISLYARLKADLETEILSLHGGGFAPLILRMATIYGLSPRMRFDLVINILALHAVTKKKIKVYGGKQWRPLVHVKDAAEAYLLAIEAPIDKVSGQIYNVGSNAQNYRIGELGAIIRNVLPETVIETVEQAPDLRDYHVNFDKIGAALAYGTKRTVESGIGEIRDAIENGVIADWDDPKYRNA